MTTEAKWAARVKAWRESGESAETFAAGKGFAAGTLRWWASELARRERGAVPIARVVRREATEAAVAIEIGGARIAVRSGFDPALLRDVIVALGGAK